MLNLNQAKVYSFREYTYSPLQKGKAVLSLA